MKNVREKGGQILRHKQIICFFINIRFALKVRLPYLILIAQAKRIYAQYCESKEKKFQIIMI